MDTVEVERIHAQVAKLISDAGRLQAEMVRFRAEQARLRAEGSTFSRGWRHGSVVVVIAAFGAATAVIGGALVAHVPLLLMKAKTADVAPTAGLPPSQ